MIVAPLSEIPTEVPCSAAPTAPAPTRAGGRRVHTLARRVHAHAAPVLFVSYAAAVIAVFHDLLVTLGIFSIFQWEISLTVIAALLTLVGFSVNDTIVVFDRIRENLRYSQRLTFEQVVNLSIMQTAARSIITSFTVVLVLAAIFVSGGETLKGLSLALLIGIISGTYSSIFNAAPLLVVWRRLQPLR